MNSEELIKRINSGEDISVEDFNSLIPDERSKLEKIINGEIRNGNSKYYKYISYLIEFDNVELLTNGHRKKIGDESWYKLVTEIYLRNPSHRLLESIVYNAKTYKNKFALEAIKKISSNNPSLFELPEIIDKLEKLFKEEPPIVQNHSQYHRQPKRKGIIYFKLTSGLIIKLIPEKFTAYRFNEELRQWQEDSVKLTEYVHGNLEGEEFETVENFPYGEPFHYGRHL